MHGSIEDVVVMGTRRIRMNVRGIPKNKCAKPCVYRYIDLEDNKIKYVGIVKKSCLEKRISDHSYNDDWCKNGIWRVEYFECETQSEVEAFEAHLIELYGTWKYYNKVKAHWGINRFLPDVEKWWKVFSESPFDDIETMNFSLLIRKALREGERNIAKELLKFVDYEQTESL